MRFSNIMRPETPVTIKYISKTHSEQIHFMFREVCIKLIEFKRPVKKLMTIKASFW